MELNITLALFLLAMIIALILDISMIIPLAFGLFLFALLAYKKGFSLKQIVRMIIDSFKDSFIVIGILLLIGALTGLWRASGTIAYFVSAGVSLIPSSIFILAAFILSAMMSFALGTSFGVTATAGVILMTIARAGNVNLVFTAGAIMSGVYVGDRGSPAASSGNLVAVLTHTDMSKNVRLMAKDALLPFVLCVALYTGLSLLSPMQNVDTTVLNLLAQEFHLVWYCLIPAILMVVLPLCKVSIRKSMIVSLIASIIVTITIQNLTIMDAFNAMIFGFTAKNPQLNTMLDGGGISSMVEVCIILLISGTYGSIFKETNALKQLTNKIKELSQKTGIFGMNTILAFCVCGIFCNQTIGIIMQNQLNMDLYYENEKEKRMLDIEDSVVVIAGIVPWCIACSVPLAMLQANNIAILFEFYLWLIPIIRIIKEKLEKNENAA